MGFEWENIWFKSTQYLAHVTDFIENQKVLFEL